MQPAVLLVPCRRDNVALYVVSIFSIFFYIYTYDYICNVSQSLFPEFLRRLEETERERERDETLTDAR